MENTLGFYYSCYEINNFHLVFNGRVDTGNQFISLCCEPIENRPTVALQETGKATIEHFLSMRANLISESISSKTSHSCANGCSNCVNYRQSRWKNDGLIHYVNLSIYPAPCNCKCIYCVFKNDVKTFNKESILNYYEKVFDTLDYAQKAGLIAVDAVWQISSGEITIHPFKNKILDIVKNKTTSFLTNCFNFDEKIGENLSSNPLSNINLSIDCGTPETWFKIKGFNNFKNIINNLLEYRKLVRRNNQIELKYIILPGINDNIKDFASLIDIMKTLSINELILSRDINVKYKMNEAYSDRLIRAAGQFIKILHKNNIGYKMLNFSPSERIKIISFTNKLLESNNSSKVESLLASHKERLSELLVGKGYLHVGLYPSGDTANLVVKLYNKFFGKTDFRWIQFNSDPELWGKMSGGIPIYSPKAIQEFHPDIIIICSFKYGDEIYESLCQYEAKGIKLVKLHRESDLPWLS